jgi:RsiW-degrading membrane proteinase PrsW (M82 family)
LFKVSQTSAAKTWWVTCGIVLLSGPLAILGALFNGYSGNGLVMVVLMGPTVEEILKLAIPLWVIEKRPWLFSQGGQVLVCAFAGGMAFAVIENWVYLNIYIPNPSELLVVWRWTVCVLLHVSCSIIAGMGLIRVRQQMHATRSRPQLIHGARWIVAAIILHGSYNLAAVLLNDLF